MTNLRRPCSTVPGTPYIHLATTPVTPGDVRRFIEGPLYYRVMTATTDSVLWQRHIAILGTLAYRL